MLTISIVSCIPDLISPFLSTSIIGKAILNQHVVVNNINLHDFGLGKHKKIDDYQYGGGKGMIITCTAIERCLQKLKTQNSFIIMLCPGRGKQWTQKLAKHFTKIPLLYKHIIIIAGRYEGFDERCYYMADLVISLGDFIISGGELIACVICDSLIRLLPNVLSNEATEKESFENGLLDYPMYTKPKVWKAFFVPEILLSGNHQKIAKWRAKQQEIITKTYRKDLLVNLSKEHKNK